MNSNVNQILAEVHKVIVGKDDVAPLHAATN